MSDFDLLSESIFSFYIQATAGGHETPTTELANHEISVKKWDLLCLNSTHLVFSQSVDKFVPQVLTKLADFEKMT